MKNILKRLVLTSQIAMLSVLVGLSDTAQAVVPANSILQIGVTVTIGGEALVQEGSPVAGVKVDLTPSPPTVLGAGVFVFEEESATITYTITTTANGLDIYTFTPELGDIEDVSGTPQLAISQNSVELGATAVMSVEGNEITVPFDGDEEDNSINGIEVGDTVVIDGQEFTVDSVTDTVETSKMGLTESMESTPTQGTLIAERQTVEVTIGNVGSLEEAATPGSIPVTLSAQSGEDQSLWPDLGLTVVAVNAEVSATVELYVRRFDGQVPAASEEGVVESLTYPVEGGPTYFSSIDSVYISAAPGTAIEYLMVFNAGSADRENVFLRTESSPFLEYEPDTTKVNNSPLADGYNRGECSVSEGCVAIESISKNEQAYVVFQMTLVVVLMRLSQQSQLQRTMDRLRARLLQQVLAQQPQLQRLQRRFLRMAHLGQT